MGAYPRSAATDPSDARSNNSSNTQVVKRKMAAVPSWINSELGPALQTIKTYRPNTAVGWLAYSGAATFAACTLAAAGAGAAFCLAGLLVAASFASMMLGFMAVTGAFLGSFVAATISAWAVGAWITQTAALIAMAMLHRVAPSWHAWLLQLLAPIRNLLDYFQQVVIQLFSQTLQQGDRTVKALRPRAAQLTNMITSSVKSDNSSASSPPTDPQNAPEHPGWKETVQQKQEQLFKYGMQDKQQQKQKQEQSEQQDEDEQYNQQNDEQDMEQQRQFRQEQLNQQRQQKKEVLEQLRKEQQGDTEQFGEFDKKQQLAKQQPQQEQKSDKSTAPPTPIQNAAPRSVGQQAPAVKHGASANGEGTPEMAKLLERYGSGATANPFSVLDTTQQDQHARQEPAAPTDANSKSFAEVAVM